MATKKITIEVEVPEGFEWLGDVAKDLMEKLTAFTILQAKAPGKINEEDINKIVEEAKEKVWERVKHAYTRS